VKIDPINVHIRSGGCPTLLEILILILFVLFPVLILAYNFRYFIEKKCFLKRILDRVRPNKPKSQDQIANNDKKLPSDTTQTVNEIKKQLSFIKTSFIGTNDTPIDFSLTISNNGDPNSQGQISSDQEDQKDQIDREMKNVLGLISESYGFSAIEVSNNLIKANIYPQRQKSNLNLGPSVYQQNKKNELSPPPPPQLPSSNNTKKKETDKENSEWKNKMEQVDDNNEFHRNKLIKSKKSEQNSPVKKESTKPVQSVIASIFGKAVNESSKSESVLSKNKKLQGIKSSHLKTNLESINGGTSNTNSNNSSRSSMHLSESQYDITSNHMYEYKSKDLPSNPSSVTEWSTEDSKFMPIAKASSISNQKANNFRDAGNEEKLNVNLIFDTKGSKSNTSQTNLTVINFLWLYFLYD
jgi:hypothetical protein